ncbi:helix-turn-helix psq domain [Holotrichia oblita]|uniref:Helix-turn-helix psq domain n=1 Tax=Holotrichia oblita TaxID=644536 RepID=A0ACB9TJV2_HOLOL|nr:helix-turn-helix psq domain [Holotrichia oblita]
MGKLYIRSTKRQEWSEESLRQAIENVSSKQMGVNEASREFGIPSKTLRRRLASGKLKTPLGRSCELGVEHETRLINHIKALEKVGFAPDRNDVRKMAYEFAEKLGIQHRFSHGMKSAGRIFIASSTDTERNVQEAGVHEQEIIIYDNRTVHEVVSRSLPTKKKPSGKVLLILDGHGSHCNSVDLLDLAALIGRAWERATTVANGVSAMKCTGIYPYDPTASPDHYLSITDSLNNDQTLENQEPHSSHNDRKENNKKESQEKKRKLSSSSSDESAAEEVVLAASEEISDEGVDQCTRIR